MEIEIIQQKVNPLLNREEIVAKASLHATPKKDEIRETLAKKLKKESNLIAVKHIYPKFGEKEFEIHARVYENEETLKKLEAKRERKKKVKDDAEEKPKKAEGKEKSPEVKEEAKEGEQKEVKEEQEQEEVKEKERE